MSLERKRIDLSYFELVFHNKFKKVTLTSELKDCFEYFDEHSPKVLDKSPAVLIHGNKIEIRKVQEGRGYSIEMDGVVKIVGVDSVSREEKIEIVKRVRNITFPYADHVAKKYKKH